MVPVEEIEKNEFNLNLPRYIDSQTPEDLQDIEGHLKGGIPAADVDALDRYWAVCPNLKSALFSPRPLAGEGLGVRGAALPHARAGEHPEGHKGQGVRAGYLDLAVEKPAIKSTIYEHPEFAAFIAGMNAHFAAWRQKSAATLKSLQPGCHPKDVITELSESLLAHYQDKPLIDPYDIYQHLLDYWAEIMQDDCYLIVAPIDT
jgi:type I restriction enzyme M protein